MEKQYWQSLEEYQQLNDDSILESKKPQPEFSVEGLDESEIKGQSSRRDFLKMLGFSVGTVALVSSCQMPVRKAIPLLNQPEDLTPGVPNFYASSFFDGTDYCSILVKTRENRPIKIEGNEMSEISMGGTSARVQASVLNLYDDARLKNPWEGKRESDWESVDREIMIALDGHRQRSRKVVLLTSTVISPSTKGLIAEFIEKYPNVEWVQYDAVSYSAMRKANEMNFKKEVIPSYHFDKANVIVSFNADFLGNWLLPVTYTRQFSSGRQLTNGKTNMNRLYQYESRMSLTGSNADYRMGIRPSEEAAVLLNLYNEIARNAGATTYNAPSVNVDVKKAAKDLLANKGKSIVVSGTNDLGIQLIVNAINHLLDNYGKTIDLNRPMHLRQGKEEEMANLVKEMNEGRIHGLLVHNVNPAYDYHDSQAFISGMGKVVLKVSFAETMDETASMCNFVCSGHNYLESWDDNEPIMGSYSFTQPTIRPIFNTRQFQDNLLKWAEIPGDYSTYIEAHWKKMMGEHEDVMGNFGQFWNNFKHDGAMHHTIEAADQPAFESQALSAGSVRNDGVELVLYEKIAMGNGKYANNPWLQEMPDPITTATWDNYLCVPVAYAEEMGLQYEDVVRINGEFELPVLIQPGQPSGTVSIALGYGRTAAGKAGNGVGQNAYHLMNMRDGFADVSGTVVSIEKVGGKTYPLATTQTHHSMEGRALARETTLPEYLVDPASGNAQHKLDEEHNVTLYQKIDFDGIHWGMTIDLTSCTGCGNCIVACQAENNVPVIGKDQIRKRRVMHWLRLDRYYSADAENPDVYHMPVMCQHCDNAPCENVCPVAATNHSGEGLNQMAYNRCIGTRYCVNNCPYKVRRFNWYEFVNNNKFDYNMNSDLGKMVLNPDVTVRQRGVVEKCSLCAQRLQAAKLTAKVENRPLVDGDVKTACSQSCPTGAIQFGNLKDENSVVSLNNKEERMYHLLEHLHTLPSTSYLTMVRNRDA
jgi:molybdopterin-containing oxidoreductase family iron-sulfur binding subunit